MRRISLLVTFCAIAIGSPVVACSSAPRNGVEPTPAGKADAGPSDFVDSAPVPEKEYTPDEIWADDPPPQWCGPKKKPPPPPPGGTPECPDDKNREGCPCSNLGETAKCWPGKRVNRNLGICVDGETTCGGSGELDKVWGPCEGYKLPKPTATKGKDACQCFSKGQWKLDNLIPCFVQASTGTYATSAACSGAVPPDEVPTEAWSKNTITVDCAGHFKLCYAIKAGDAKNPKSTDCELMQVCTEGDYLEADKPQSFPALPGWLSHEGACADQMLAGSGVYGEMTVVGKSVLCDEIGSAKDPLVFNRVPYCPMDCGSRPNDADCKSCGSTGAGQF